MKKIFLILILSFVLSTHAYALTPYSSAQSQAQLIFSRLDANTVQVGLWIELKDHWHTYWQNPGHAGLAPNFTLEISPHVAVGDLQYPLPERITSGPLTTFGYHKQVLFLRNITLPETDTSQYTLKAKIKYLVCDSQCLIEKTEFTTNLSAKVLPTLSAHSESDILNQFVWPQPKTDWNMTTQTKGDSVTLTIAPKNPLTTQITDFFPARQVPIEFEKPEITANDVQTTIKLKKSDLTPEKPVFAGLIMAIDKTTNKPFGIWYETDLK